ncbi:MAG: DUF3806 domain-containing protein [Helicobacteraceae bacterium]|nr:DUF3806 domain-containing protein [Helicobacteraceae bacterium]
MEEDKSTLLLYNPKTNDVWIRISVTTVELKDKTENSMFDHIINLAKKQKKKVEIVSDKSYIFEFQQTEEDGDQIITYFYQIGYKYNSILISVTTYLENSTTETFKSRLAEIPEYIASIKEISLDKQNFFDLTNDDCLYINKRSAEILEITEEKLDDFHERGETLKTIQKFLDNKKFNAENTLELQSLGIAFGDYIQYKYPNFQWNIIRDEYGRDFCLNYAKTAITIFPQTMISKRVEDAEKINIESLLSGLLKIVKEIDEKGK